MCVLLRSYGSFSLSPSVIGLCLLALDRACGFYSVLARFSSSRLLNSYWGESRSEMRPTSRYAQQGDGLALALLLPRERRSLRYGPLQFLAA